MNVSRWFGRAESRRTPSRRSNVRLSLESLERRDVPSASMLAPPQGAFADESQHAYLGGGTDSPGSDASAASQQSTMNAPLAASTAPTLSDLREQYGFYFSGNYYLNYLGTGEKWFFDRDREWYVIRPDGSIHYWLGGNSTAPLLDDSNQPINVGSSVWQNPTLLFNAPVSLTTEQQAQLSQLRVDYGFRFTGNYFHNAFGLNEKWFQSRDQQWFILRTDGSIYRWQGGNSFTALRDASNVPVVVSPLVYDDPSRLFTAPVSLTASESAELSQLREQWGFRYNGDYYNYLGLGEKWFVNRQNQWHVIRPDGSIWVWRGGNSIVPLLDGSNQAVVVSKLAYDEPDRLFHAVVSVSQDRNELAALRTQFGFQQAPSYWTNYLGQGEKWFLSGNNTWLLITPNGLLWRWTGNSAVPLVNNGTQVQVTRMAYDYPELLFSGSTPLSSADQTMLTELQEEHAFRYVGTYFYNQLGMNEKWFEDRLGQDYYIKPDGTIWLWTRGVSTQLRNDAGQAVVVNAQVWIDPFYLFLP